MIDIGIHSTSIKSRMPNQWENTAKLSIEAPRNSKSDFSMSRRPPVSPTFVSSRLSISADVILREKNRIRFAVHVPVFFRGSNEDFLFTPLSDHIFCQRRMGAKRKVENADIPGAADTITWEVQYIGRPRNV